jgi:hypothetical protein
VGLGDLEAVDGQGCDLGSAGAAHDLFVGDRDVTTEYVNQAEQWKRFGVTRLERARALHVAFQAAAIEHEYVEIPGLAHDDPTTEDWPMKPVWRFLAGGAGTRDRQPGA